MKTNDTAYKKIILCLNIVDNVVCDAFVCVFLFFDSLLASLFRLLLNHTARNFFDKLQKQFVSDRLFFIKRCHFRGGTFVFYLPAFVIVFVLATRWLPSISSLAIIVVEGLIYYKLTDINSETNRYFPVFERGFRHRLSRWRFCTLVFFVAEIILAYYIIG